MKFLRMLVDYILSNRVSPYGRNPYFSVFHPQYLATREHNVWIQNNVILLKGCLLDYGCGNMPYKSLMRDCDYIGADIPQNSNADIFVVEGFKLPEIKDQSIDCIFSTQVMEHVQNPDLVVEEWRRVIVKNGTLLVTVPFLFNVHGYPYDYRRFTERGLEKYFSDKNFEVVKLETFGGIGSLLVVSLQNWLETQPGKLFLCYKLISTPFVPFYSFVLNIIGLTLNKIDKTNSFYSSVGILLKVKK